MAEKKLVRDMKREALIRMEEAARSPEDFYEVLKEWKLRDDNRERKERYHEMQRPNETILHNFRNRHKGNPYHEYDYDHDHYYELNPEIKRPQNTVNRNTAYIGEVSEPIRWRTSAQSRNQAYIDGMIFPIPISHPAWHEALFGNFLSMIYDTPEEMWQIIEDIDIAKAVKKLSFKQVNTLFLSTIRRCGNERIAYCYSITDRAVRKMLAAALKSIRDEIAPIIRAQLKSEHPNMTISKRRFIEWYDN